jgi:ABC-2 type transport system permease protein
VTRLAPARPGDWRWMLGPKLRTRVNRARTDRSRILKATLLAAAGALFWSIVFTVIFRMLLYFRGTQGIGDLLAGKLLGLALLTFFMILLLSNVVAALSTFFLSDDMELLMASPVDSLHLYAARLAETVGASSWMVALLSAPLLVAYGVVYGGGLGYYLLAVATMGVFLVIPAVLGSAVTLLLVNVFPARRTRDLLALVGLFAVAGVVVLFRFLRPERLVRPDEFRDLVDFIAVLRTPTSPWLPSQWVADSLMGWLGGAFDPFPVLLLASTAAALFVNGRYHPSGFTRAQEGAERKDGRTRGRTLERVLGRLPARTRELVIKEIRVFFRDTTQWSQLVLLAVLVAVYVYNIQVLPLYTGERVSFFLVNAVSFLNLGLAGFVVAAIAARFVFPAMSLEGRMMWLLRSSPVDVRSLFWTKYWVGTVPLLCVSVPLIIVTNLVLGVSPFVLTLTTVTMVGLTLGLTSLALGFGALYPNYETENVAEIPTSFGGLLFMMAAVTYLAVVVVLEAWPVYRFLNERAGDVAMRAVAAGVAGGVGAGGAVAEGGVGAVAVGGSMAGGGVLSGAGVLPIVVGLGGAAAITVAVIFVSLAAGVRRVRTADF